MRLFQGLTAVGVVAGRAAAWLCRSYAMAMIYVLVPGLLWFYSASYKRMLVVGNLIVAFCAALTPLLVALANIGRLNMLYPIAMPYMSCAHDLLCWLGGFAVFAFLTTWKRDNQGHAGPEWRSRTGVPHFADLCRGAMDGSDSECADGGDDGVVVLCGAGSTAFRPRFLLANDQTSAVRRIGAGGVRAGADVVG